MASESLAATAAEQFVHQIGTGTVVHNSGDLFSEHLVSVQRVLESWHAGRELELAGLYHSIYGTEGFQDFCLSFNRRPDVRTLIGERAEFVAFVNCVIDRITLDATLDAAPGEHCVRARPDVGGERIPLTDRQFTDLITVHLADWLEQIEREAAKVNVRHGWLKPGDAWGYRRRAYRRISELLQGPALARYDQVFAREPAHTRHICQGDDAGAAGACQAKVSTVPAGPMGGETKAKDGSTTGSGGKNDYQMETEGGKWELERNDPKEMQEQLKAGDADAAKTNMAVEKEDPDYKPPADA